MIQTLDETQPKFTGIDSAVARLVELLADRSASWDKTLKASDAKTGAQRLDGKKVP